MATTEKKQSKKASVTDTVMDKKENVSIVDSATTSAQISTIHPGIDKRLKTTVKKSQVFVPGLKSEPSYKLLTDKPETTTSAGSATKKGLIVGVSVGVVLGVVLVAAILLLVFFLKKRKKRKFKEEIVQVENPRYAGFARGVSSPDRGRNNNKNGDIEILATRVSSRKKRRAPAPPGTFGDADVTSNKRDSPELSPPVELSTFSTNKPEKEEVKPLLNKNNGKTTHTETESDNSSDVEGTDERDGKSKKQNKSENRPIE